MFRKHNSCGSCGLVFHEPTKCQQHLSRMTDINYMVSRAIAGDASVFRHGSYGDYTSVPDDAQALLNMGVKAREAYEGLSADVRAVYPSAEVFLAALANPDEKERLTRLGVFAADAVSVRLVDDGVNAESVKGTNPEAKPLST